MFSAYIDWARMSPEGWIQGIGAVLLFLMVWLVKSLVNNHDQMLIDMKEQATKDRQLIREECACTRIDHQQDMQALFADSKENRRSHEMGFKEIASAIRSLSSEIRKGGMPT